MGPCDTQTFGKPCSFAFDVDLRIHGDMRTDMCRACRKTTSADDVQMHITTTLPLHMLKTAAFLCGKVRVTARR